MKNKNGRTKYLSLFRIERIIKVCFIAFYFCLILVISVMGNHKRQLYFSIVQYIQ